MKWFQKQLRKHKSIVSLMLFLLGLIIIMQSNKNDVLSGIGISVLASALTTLVTIFFIDDDDKYETVRNWGLEHVYATRGEMNASSGRYIQKAKYVKTIAFGMKSWRDAKTGEVRKLLQRGGYVRIITMDPECATLKARERDENDKGIGDSIRGLVTWAERLNREPGCRGKIEIKMHDHLPLEFVFLMNNRLFTGPYEYGKSSQQTVSFEYNNYGEAFEYYEDMFDTLWDNQEFCKDALTLDRSQE